MTKHSPSNDHLHSHGFICGLNKGQQRGKQLLTELTCSLAGVARLAHVYQKGHAGAGKMTQWSRALTVLPEDPGLSLSIHKTAHKGLYVYSSPKESDLFWPPRCTDLYAGQTPTHIKVIDNNKEKPCAHRPSEGN